MKNGVFSGARGGFSAVAALVCIAFPSCGLATGEPVDPASIVRQAIAASCAEPGADADALGRRIGGARLRREEPLSRDAAGWRRRYALEGGAELEIASASNSRGRELQAIYRTPAARGMRDKLLAIAGPDCAIRLGRELEYSADGRARAIWFLHADLSASGAGELLDAPVPAAPDPGGVAVAQVDSGVNYLLPAIASRLARNPDGAALGYDWWDMDRQPFDQDPSRSAFFPRRHGTRTASLLLEEAPHARLVPYRYPRPDMSRMAALIASVAQAGVSIVNVSMGSNDRAEWAAYERGARAHPGILFVVSAGNNGRDIDRDPVYPAALRLGNQITVTSSENDGTLAQGSNWGRQSVDLLVPAERVLVTDFDGRRRFASGSSYAVSRVGALAACLQAAQPQWRARELRAAILARVIRHAESGWSMHGFLPDPVASERGACPAAQASVTELARDSFRGASLTAASAAGPPPTKVLDLSVAMLNGSGWESASVRNMLRGAATILGQCGIGLRKITVHLLSGPERLRYFTIETAMELAGGHPLAKPVAYLVDATRRPVPYDAEAFAPANSARFPLLSDTVWITRRTPDPGIALAHELVHVLTDNGEHASLPDNLMRDQTAPQNTNLTEDQCNRIRRSGTERRMLAESRR